MNLEFNKLFAALLVAGITASSAAFISGQIMHPHELEEDAVPIEGVESVSGGAPSGPKGPEPVLHLLAAADVARGEKLSKACAACHSFDKGGADRVGPNLWNVVGRAPAGKSGFAYSDAMASLGGTWGYQELNKFLYKPKNFVAGTKMNYIGLKKPEDRAAMIAWLRTLNDSPAALPSDAAIAAEKAELAPEPETEETEVASEEEATDTSEAEINEDTTEENAANEEEAAEESEDAAVSNVEPEAGEAEENDQPLAENMMEEIEADAIIEELENAPTPPAKSEEITE